MSVTEVYPAGWGTCRRASGLFAGRSADPTGRRLFGREAHFWSAYPRSHTADTVRVRETNGVVAFQDPGRRNQGGAQRGRSSAADEWRSALQKRGFLSDHHLLQHGLRAVLRGGARYRAVVEGANRSVSISNRSEHGASGARATASLPEKDGICPACVESHQNDGAHCRLSAAPYRKQAITLTVLSLVMTGLSLAPPAIQGALIDGVLTPHRNLHLLWTLMFFWLATLAINSVVQIMNGRLIAFLAGNIAADLRSSLYRAIEFLQLSYFDKKQIGAITSRVTQDTDRVWGFLVDGLPYLVTNVLLLVGLAIFMLSINVKLTLCILAPLPVVFLLSGIFWRARLADVPSGRAEVGALPYPPQRVAGRHSRRQGFCTGEP